MTLSESGAADAAPADDLRATIAASIAEVRGASETPAPVKEAPTQSSDRDERGRFAAKDTPDARDETAADEPGDETKDDAQQPEAASKPERLAAPEGWPSDAKLAWDRLPRAAQDALRADLEAGRLSVGSKAQSEPAPDPVRQVLNDYQSEIARIGVAPEQAVKALFDAQRVLDANPAEGLKWLARSYGVDLRSLVPQDAQGAVPQAEGVTPEVHALRQEINQLKGYLTQQERAQHEARVAETTRTIEDFAKAKTEDGAPKYPFFADVRATMGRLIQSGEAAGLEDAYDKAVWARPDLRQRMLEAERKAEAAKREAEQRKAAEEAKKRAGSVKTNPSVTAAPAEGGSLREDILRAMRGGA